MENKTPAAKTPVAKYNYRHEYEKDSQKVKGKFIFHEVPGGAVSFTYRKYREEQPKNYTFKDGDIYEIPLGVARHLNKNCWYPQYEFMKGEQGSQDVQRVGQKVRRMSFQSLEFVDIEDFSNQVQPLTRVDLAGI